MTKAPSVNQMRFLSSSALPKADQLMLAASCSAADAIRSAPSGAARRVQKVLTWTDEAQAENAPRPSNPSYGRPAAICHHLRGASGLSARFGLQHLDLAAGLLDGGDRALRGGEDFERQFRFQFALAEDLHAIARPRADAGRAQGLDRHRLGGVELARIERLLDAAEIDLVNVACGRIDEAALGQAAMQGHLAAFKALDAHAGAGRLTLAAATRLLAFAGADAAPDAGARLRGARIVGDVVEFHVCPHRPSMTRTRCATLAIMPRAAGVSRTALRRPILLRPRPIRVWRGSILRPMALTGWSSVIILGVVDMMGFPIMNPTHRPRRRRVGTAAWIL